MRTSRNGCPGRRNRRSPARREFIRKTRKQLEDNDGFQGVLVVDGRIVGAGRLLGVKWEARRTGIGYWLAEEHQSRGLIKANDPGLGRDTRPYPGSFNP